MASEALAELTRSRQITCEPKTQDRYGRTVALCRADGRDLGAAMVRVGMAYAFTRYSLDYVDQEGGERRARRCPCPQVREALGLAGAHKVSEEQRPYISIPPAKMDEHHYRCPICHQVVDVRDVDEVARHPEPGHMAPTE